MGSAELDMHGCHMGTLGNSLAKAWKLEGVKIALSDLLSSGLHGGAGACSPLLNASGGPVPLEG